MLPLLALRRQPPTGLPLSDNKVEIKCTRFVKWRDQQEGTPHGTAV